MRYEWQWRTLGVAIIVLLVLHLLPNVALVTWPPAVYLTVFTLTPLVGMALVLWLARLQARR